MNLRQVGEDVNYLNFGGTFATKKLNNGDFDYWLFVELVNMAEATGETDGDTYMISIRAVAPSEVPEKRIEEALSTIGLDQFYQDKISKKDIAKILNEEGIGANLFSKQGNNAKELFQIARKECEKINMLFGFYMDRNQNMLGNSGWDFIKGQIGLEF